MHAVLPALLAAALTAPPELSDPLTLAVVTRAAMAANPELAASTASARAADAAARGARALPEPMLSYQAWQQPISHPLDPGETNMHMFGVRWSIPFPGQLGLAGRAADEGALASRADVRARRLSLQAQVAHAFVAWWRSARELEVHLRQMSLAERTVEATNAKYAAGGASQADILRAETDLHRLHADVAGLREASTTAGALLNAVMGRAAAAPLPAAAAVETVVIDAAGPVERPEVQSAQSLSARAEAIQALDQRARRAPDLMIGLDYMVAPHMPDAYSVMVQVALPWFSGRRSAEADRAEAEADQARRAADAVRVAAGYEESEAGARARAARAQLEVLDSEVLPRASRTVDALRAAYVAGRADLTALLDAERTLLDAGLSAVRQRATLADAIADLRRARGVDLLEGAKP